MSYLLIGNISALICDDCIEPLANARIRVYLPDIRYPDQQNSWAKGIFNDLRPLTAKDVLMKADRLLAEAPLDEWGNFSLSWEEVHLFTEPLELDLCLDVMPGKTGSHQPRNYHLSNVVLHWKRSSNGYLGAYAYVVPSASWNTICRDAGSWVITGTVRHYQRKEGQLHLKVQAYNAISGKMIGEAYTNEFGRYTIRFSRKDLYSGHLQPVRQGRTNMGPDVYFRIYNDDRLILSENENNAAASERQDLPPCSCLNIEYKSSAVRRASAHINGWISDMISLTAGRRKKREQLRMAANYR
ncbi:hypothetical protein ECE50_007005 [Chitinophaga sp. Mgbs1]|uniref:Uncharacterized protein n=1 Tax=Chitinophaga solisilvae TaxID=1233460 RepID=A0A433W9L5_9BACT|nr:hypothetical protein [Chitinophaga solisilvae]